MRERLLLLAVLVPLAACGGGDDTPGDDGPFADLPVSGEFVAPGLDGAVHVARDEYGIAHINATTTGDVAFAQGYVMAHDRLPQMDILRRFGAGTLGVLFGALDQGVVETDLEMRMHRMKPLAEEAFAMLQASSAPVDQDLVRLLTRFADGVNAYATDLQSGRWDLDDAIEASFDPSRFEPWTAVDSLVLGRFQAFALSWTMPAELDLTELYQGLHETYDLATNADPAAFKRRGISSEILQVEPVGKIATIDGFPNVDPDTGTRSDAGRPQKRGQGKGNDKHAKRTRAAAGPARPHVPAELFANARRFFADKVTTGPFGAYGPHAFMAPNAGSNNWAVAPSLAGGKALLATDQHLQLPNPSIFYPTHLTVGTPGAPPAVDVMGITFPGIPGVILGTNGKVAWSATVSYHDVNDVYLEQIAPCPSGGGDCVLHDGAMVPIETRTETIQLGALGTVTSTREVVYEVVPHHGPIVPTIVNGEIVPRTADSALSVAYTGYVPTFEIRAVWNLAHANNVDEAFRALADFSYGSQNWTMIDNSGNIAWTTNAKVPLRQASAYAWNPQTNPDGLAPFFVLPGNTGGDWEGFMSSRYVPHAINPASGYLATANADPVGATFDRDALNQPVVDGRPLYAGISYTEGLREERISLLIEEKAAQGPLDLAAMAQIQHDTNSSVGRHLRDSVVAALAVIDGGGGLPADAVAYYADLSAADQGKLATARTLLADWTLETPAMLDGDSGDTTDSAATAVFNAFMHFFIAGVIGDEVAALPTPYDVWRIEESILVRTVWGVLVEPETYTQSAQSDQPILCDDIAVTGADQSCTLRVLMALVSAMDGLAAPAVFGSADTTTWRWGEKHRLTLEPLFPNSSLQVPPPSETNPRWVGGYPKAGDNVAVNVANMGWNNLNFAQFGSGPAQRFLAEALPGETIKVKWALPGGVIYDRASPHYRDLMDEYYIPQTHFDAPFVVADIVAHGEDRWVFRGE
jgi:penicillin amidase